MRGLWKSRYLDRRPYGAWEADPDKYHREALERARTLLAEHQPVRLDPALDAELRRLIADHAARTGVAAPAGVA